MSPMLLVSGCLMALLPGGLPDGPLPVEAYVVRDRASIRSGPGPDYYATDQLELGAPVEVYRRDAGGWLAIRPPQGSYSLVSANQLKQTARDGVARVTGSEAVAWVATRHGPVTNHKWQVQLKVGELVRVLGEQHATLFEGAVLEKTYRIAPPAGEFRWIHEDDVDGRRPGAVAPARSQQADPSEELPTDEDGVPALELAEYRLLVESEPEPDTTGRNAHTSSAAQRDPSAWRARPVRSLDSPPAEIATAPNPGIRRENEGIPRENEIARLASTSLPPQASETLRKIDLQLSLMVSQPPEQWDLTSLRRLALEMVDSGETAVDRGRARLMLEKITQFAEIQQRYRRIESTGGATETGSGGAVNTAVNRAVNTGAGRSSEGPASAIAIGPIGSGLASDSSADVQYDARGVLVPVHSRTGRVPPYALVDGNGQVLKYVSPSPGLNLHRYLGKRIGIMGQRGYLSTIEARHVTAHRVIQLDRHTR